MDETEFTNDLAQVLLLSGVASVPSEWVGMSYRQRLVWLNEQLTTLELAVMVDELRGAGVCYP